ncbi:alpha/beta hydrolase [Actinoplanes sp. NBRC 14428]|uniref:Acetyl esterase/lipase n=1 Tax=Pseudosporangium ferrugineum TaxID=439699 RepID=A0A2T0RF76_9ACTN|nr:alpha/beta hydrolase [Pseudosporangium ferrugineum]PRY19815.1 acetyl esterase/lipase [Pseudosporangium ferrugineum]BCJ50550.1 alpha/beta hydrolase [Actinoplanes sp. NBRC 14428]
MGSTISSKDQVEPELLAALEGVPPFGVSAATLAGFRPAVDALTLAAPDAPGVTTVERQVPRADGTTIPVRVHTPAGGTARGALIFLHGGGQIMGSSVGYDAQSRHFAHTAGCVVVAVDYRLAPEHPYPAGLEDCHTVLTWLHASAAELGFPAGRIAVAGESGGGGLAAGLALLARDRGEVALSAQFLQYPMLDDRTATDAEPDPLPYAGEFVWTAQSHRFAWQSVLGEAVAGPDVPVYAAPARATDVAGVAPAYLVVGQLDLLAGEALRYVRTLIRSGVPTELDLVPGAYHAFMSFAPEAETSRRASARFLDAIVRHFR